MDKEEHWRDIKCFEGKYQVSNEGRVRSVEKACKTPVKKRKVTNE